MTLNPIKAYFQWKSAEREADRALIRDAIMVLGGAFDAQSKTADVMKEFLASFNTPGVPIIREWDELEDAKKYLERTGRALPDELKGLNQFDQFSRVLAKMDEEF